MGTAAHALCANSVNVRFTMSAKTDFESHHNARMRSLRRLNVTPKPILRKVLWSFRMQAQAIRSHASPGILSVDESRALDLVHLSRQTMGDRELEIELLGLFDRQAGQIMERLEGGLGSADRKWRHDLSHTLKGSARAIGAMRVGACAQAYEDALAADADEGELASGVRQLKSAVEEAQAAIRDLLADA